MMTAPTLLDHARLITLAQRERREFQTRLLLDHARRELAQRPADEPLSDDDVAWHHGVYLVWAAAWEALQAAREGLGMGR